MPDISRLLDWLALLTIALISVTVPTFAISVTFYGRESRRVRKEKERKLKTIAEELERTSHGLRAGLQLDVLEMEISGYKKELEDLEDEPSILGVWGAVIVPTLLFTGAIVFESLGLLTLQGFFGIPAPQTPESAAEYWTLASIIALAGGSYFLGKTLFAIDRVAKTPETLIDFRVSFASGSPAERFHISEQASIPIIVHNWGKDTAESVVVDMYFPDRFQVLPGPYGVHVQPTHSMMNYPGRVTLSVAYEDIHEDILLPIVANLILPNVPGTYEVPVFVWEKKTGKTVHTLIFEVG
jgi:hypothetical protein